jgi:hypothetical protein
MQTRTRAQAPARYEIQGVESAHVSLVVNMQDHYAISYTVEIRDGVKWATVGAEARTIADAHGIEYHKLESYLLSEIEAP